LSVSIILSNGTRFNDPEARIREYCEVEVYRDIGYRGGYDDHHSVTDVITEEDLEAADNLYALLRTQDRQRILRNPRIPSLLAAIRDAELGGLTDEDWEGVKSTIRPLLSEFISIPNVKLAKAMKILHLKRPHLFPILDSFVVKFLTRTDTTNLFSEDEWLQIGLTALETARADIVKNRAAFDELKNRVSDLPTPLTIVRLYDILCWTQEKWVNRGNPTAKYGTASKSLNQAGAPTGSPPALAGTPPPGAGERQAKEAPVGEIPTTKEFRQIRLRAEGVIVNTASSPPRAHRPLCEEVTEERFQTTMIFNEGKHGKYYLRGSLAEAVRDFGAVGCKKCRPERPVSSALN
jgi:hypothetical protein